MTRLASYLPIFEWGRTYDRLTLTNDLVAAVIVTIMLIPQSLAYALLAGLPPEMGLYASMLPIGFMRFLAQVARLLLVRSRSCRY